MEKIAGLIQQLEKHISNAALINPVISASSVGWQIEHSLLTINLIIDQLKKSDPNKYSWKFSIGRLIILTTKKIPRGRAQAPKIVQPKEDFNLERLNANIEIANERIKELSALNKNHYFEHPYFGKLNVKPAIQFLQIHTQHHLAIIDDIVKSTK